MASLQYAGLVPVPVAIPTSLGGRGAYVEQLRHQLEGCGAAAAWAPKDLLWASCAMQPRACRLRHAGRRDPTMRRCLRAPPI